MGGAPDQAWAPPDRGVRGAVPPALICALFVQFSKVIMRVFVSCGVQLVEDQYLETQWHSIGFEDIRRMLRFDSRAAKMARLWND